MDGIKGQAWVVSFALLPAAADVERQAHSNNAKGNNEQSIRDYRT